MRRSVFFAGAGPAFRAAVCMVQNPLLDVNCQHVSAKAITSRLDCIIGLPGE